MTVQFCIMPAENCAFKAVMILSVRQERNLNSAIARGCKRGLKSKKNKLKNLLNIRVLVLVSTSLLEDENVKVLCKVYLYKG